MIHRVVFPVVGCVLLLAASMKLLGINASPYAVFGWLASPNFQIIAINWEIALGLWLLSGYLRTVAWLFATATFLAFAGISAYLGSIGQTSCGCFGTIEASPWVAFGIDLTVLSALILSRPEYQTLRQIHTPEVRKSLRRGLLYVSCIAAVFFTLSEIAIFGYGSARAALAHLRGEVVYAEPSFIDFGEGLPGEMIESSVQMTNRSERPIRLIGGTSDCSCITTKGLPITIPPGETISIPLKLRVPNTGSGAFTRIAELWTDCDSARKTRLTLGCNVRNSGNTSQLTKE